MKKKIIDFSLGGKISSFVVFHFVVVLVMLFDWAVFSFSVRGRKHLKERKAFLVSNHTLYMEPGLIAHAIFPRRTYFSALAETFDVPGLGSLIRFLGAFPVSEQWPFGLIIPSVRRALDERGFVHFFPEGEINKGSRGLNPFKEGVFFLACFFDVPIIPVVSIPSKRRLFGRSLSFLPPRVTIKIGKPVYPAQFKKESRKIRNASVKMKEHMWERMNTLITRG